MTPSEIRNKRILISPLNWGMGHVSRCIGLIHQLIGQENEIFIACDEMQRGIFTEYFPKVHYIHHDGYPFKFGGNGNFSWDMVARFSSLSERLKKERKEVAAYIKEHSIDLILSDHRYGFHSKTTPSVFITHQFNLPVRWFEFLVSARHRQLMFSFHNIWVMDTEKFEFAGKLSVSAGEKRVTYIGPYSRFSLYDIPKKKEGETVLVISGPTVYGQQLLDERIKGKQKDNLVVIASGEIQVPSNVHRVSDNWKEQDKILLNAKKIISRSGYSTIMDLHFLQTDSELYATKGQREQKYLLNYHRKQ